MSSFTGDLDSISTENLPWAEMLAFDFCKTFKITQLNRLRSFLKDGVTFNVVAVKHSYVPEDPKLSEEQNKEDGAQAGGMSERQSVKTSASKDRMKLHPDTKERKKSAKAKVRQLNSMKTGTLTLAWWELKVVLYVCHRPKFSMKLQPHLCRSKKFSGSRIPEQVVVQKK